MQIHCPPFVDGGGVLAQLSIKKDESLENSTHNSNITMEQTNQPTNLSTIRTVRKQNNNIHTRLHQAEAATTEYLPF